jgi:hypothetical protein
MKQTKQDARDIRRILGRAVLKPTEMEISEALCLKLIRDSLRDAEFDFRYNNRAALGVNDQARTQRALSGIVGNG